MNASLVGRLLVATPLLVDANFDRTVVLMLEHGDAGALGVVLNRPSEIDLSDALPPWKPFAAYPPVVFRGGPVAPGAAIGLARTRGVIDPSDAPEGVNVLFDDVATVDLSAEPATVSAAAAEVRVFSAYAGWDHEQLESEIAAHAWFVVARAGTDAFTADPGGLWRTVLRRQRGRLSLFAHFPDDPACN